MSRISDTFATLKGRHTPGLVTYVTAGDPDLATSGAILQTLARNGADVLEVGVPFSDPLADGPVIQRASERALASGATLRRTLDMIRDLRASIEAPIVLFTYVNPILRLGEDVFVAAARSAGIDGVLVLDLPAEEAGALRGRLASAGIDLIFLLSPTTSDARIQRSAELGSGFLYVISRLGVTGARQQIAADAEPLVRRIRARSSLPLALGFGVSTPEHVTQIGRWADAAVVGSALVSVIAAHGQSRDLLERVGAFTRALKGLS